MKLDKILEYAAIGVATVMKNEVTELTEIQRELLFEDLEEITKIKAKIAKMFCAEEVEINV